MLSSFAEGGETARALPLALSSPRHLEPTKSPKAPKLKVKPQAEGAKIVKGTPISTLLSKQGKGVLKRISSQDPPQSSSVTPSSSVKKGVEKTYSHSPKRVK